MPKTTQDSLSPVLPRLRAEAEDLPDQAGRLARVILDDPQAAARLSIAGLATAAGTSEASVTRLAQRLGYDGLPDLRIALTSEVAARRSEPGSIAGDIGLDDDTAVVKAKVLSDLTLALRDTAAALDDTVVDGAAEAVVSARRTVVVGIGASGIVATDLARKLERIGLPALAVTEYHDAMTTCVATTPADVVMGISHSGETVDVVEPLSRAASRGAATVAVTSRQGSSLARSCDHLLVSVAGTEAAFRPAAMSSRAAQLFVVDVLFVAVVQRDYERAAPLLSASWEALSQRHPDRPQKPARSRTPKGR